MTATMLLVLAATVTTTAALRCTQDWECGVGGACDTVLSCCRVRGCPSSCPAGQACVAVGYPRCGKFSKLTDTCACPRKHGCVPLRHLLSEIIFKRRPEPESRQLPWLVPEQRPREEPRRPPQVVPTQLSGAVSKLLSEDRPEALIRRPYQLGRFPQEDRPAQLGRFPQEDRPVQQEQQSRPREVETQQQRPDLRREQVEEDEREWLDIFYDL